MKLLGFVLGARPQEKAGSGREAELTTTYGGENLINLKLNSCV